MRLTHLVILLALGCSASSSYLAARIIKFPEEKLAAISPDGRFSIINKDNDNDQNHVIYIRDNISRSIKPVIYYNRHIDIGWSPNSKRFFVNNYKESNISDCEIITTNAGKKISIAHAITKQDGAILLGNDDSHFYVTCLSWLNPQSVSVSVVGYNGPRSGSINRKLKCDLGSTHITCGTGSPKRKFRGT